VTHEPQLAAPARRSSGNIRIEMQVERWPIERLIPRMVNPRTDSDQQIAQIAASMQQFGWTNPILAGPDDVIIAGHGRLLAARKLRMAEVPVIVLADLTEAQRRALVIADNQLALNAGWDEELLRIELGALRDDDFDLNLIGFEDEELARLLAAQDATEGLTDEDAVPDVPETPTSVLGDNPAAGEERGGSS
jgi:ParB-like chromosome segregation protein Spo0J